jgi:hypothetical protein
LSKRPSHRPGPRRPGTRYIATNVAKLLGPTGRPSPGREQAARSQTLAYVATNVAKLPDPLAAPALAANRRRASQGRYRMLAADATGLAIRLAITPSLNGYAGSSRPMPLWLEPARTGRRCGCERRLFHRYRLRQIARLINIRAHDDGGVIGDELHQHGVDERGHRRRHGRQRERHQRLACGGARALGVGH